MDILHFPRQAQRYHTVRLSLGVYCSGSSDGPTLPITEKRGIDYRHMNSQIVYASTLSGDDPNARIDRENEVSSSIHDKVIRRVAYKHATCIDSGKVALQGRKSPMQHW